MSVGVVLCMVDECRGVLCMVDECRGGIVHV